MKKELVVKDNALINASYTLSLVEQRLILLAIIEARESGKGISADNPLTIHAENYINVFGVSKSTAYQALKDASRQLFLREFSYYEPRGKNSRIRITSRWVSQIGYEDNAAVVELIFAPAVVPLVTQLEKHFTSYDLEQIGGLSSAYAVRLYEMMVCWRSTGKTPAISIEELRQRLGVLDTEYQRMERFKSRVLDLAVSQINEHTDIIAKYEQYKRGRSISGFSFTFKPKHPKLEPKGRLTITKAQAQEKARLGEGWHELYKRLSADFIISD